MKVRIASDLHVDLNEMCYNISPQEIINKLSLKGIDLLILAGDTAEYPKNLAFCLKIMEQFPELKIIEIPGNHLYYTGEKLFLSMDEIDDLCRNFAKDYENYYFLNNNVVTIDNIDFIGSTMWTRLGERFSYIKTIVRCLSDFYCILNNNYELISYHDIIKLHNKSWEFIKNSLNKSKNECVVITHHAPFYEYLSEVSHAFGIDLKQRLCRLKHLPKCWIYGHTHVNSSKKFVCKNGDFPMITNQFGYKGESEQGSQFNAWQTFDNNKTIEL